MSIFYMWLAVNTQNLVTVYGSLDYEYMFFSDRLRQPRNTHEWMISALFGIVAPMALFHTIHANIINFLQLVSVTGSVLQIFGS